jgi:hypothetical protein
MPLIMIYFQKESEALPSGFHFNGLFTVFVASTLSGPCQQAG